MPDIDEQQFWKTTALKTLPWRCAQIGNVLMRRPYGNIGPELKSHRPGRLPSPKRPTVCVMYGVSTYSPFAFSTHATICSFSLGVMSMLAQRDSAFAIDGATRATAAS